MSCFNFIIMKVNGADVSNLPYEDAVQLFLNAEEPIIVEVRRKCMNENNKLSFFNYDDDSPYKSPTLAVIASSSSISSNAPLVSHVRKDDDKVLKASSSTNNSEKPANSSISCQTDLSAFDGESKEINSQSGIFFQTTKSKLATTNTDVVIDEEFDDYLKTEFDFEEIVLTKSQSAENLGFTISYSTDDFLASDSETDEYDGDADADRECVRKNRKLKDDKDYSLLDEKFAPKCKIYVSDIIPNSLADHDGRLRQGDRILQINGQNVLEKIDPDKLLKENKYSVKILVCRYAFGGDDDFLDSAVYCDDKECQEDKHNLSSIYEYEQNTFSSSSKLEQTSQSVITTGTGTANNTNKKISTMCQILPLIATENVCDIFNHADIKDQLETVSKEISLLNSQISVMKQLQTEASSIDKRQHQQQQMSSSSPKKVKKKNQKSYYKTKDNKLPIKSDSSPPGGDKDVVEHIYETIPEDADSDVYYCSPYEGVNERRVEEWLKSIGCPNSNVNSGIHMDKNRIEIHPVNLRLQKQNNTILDDYDNSSSAYNTGGSCSSAFLALESNKPSVDYQNDRQNSRTLVSKSLSKTNHSSEKYVCRKPDISSNIKYHTGNPETQTPPSTTILFKVPSINTDATEAASTAIDSDGHSTLVAKSSVYRMCHSKVIDEYKEKDMSGMVWKVKRRPDGSRYIVRRVSTTIPEKNRENLTIQPESASAIDVDYKRQFNRVKERSRNRHHKAPAIPSKEKTHSQHWLV
ncbi:slo-interacting protein 1-like [Episyrphus balteatus]|uniref:slo-interacting protein 1-like n=1 Tax=Episyrphus balteatus TaxID=286459 RepID=UPI002485B58E|nr:slo-interacting protein 1-like [Episyrphus balteatus]